MWVPSSARALEVNSLLAALTAQSVAAQHIVTTLRAGRFPLTLVVAVSTATSTVMLTPAPPQPPSPPPRPPLPPAPVFAVHRKVSCALALRSGGRVPAACQTTVAGSVVGAILGLLALYCVLHAAIHFAIGHHLRKTSVTCAVAVRCECGAELFEHSADIEEEDAFAGRYLDPGARDADFTRSTTARRLDTAFAANGHRFAAPATAGAVTRAMWSFAVPCLRSLSADTGGAARAVVRPLYRHPLVEAHNALHPSGGDAASAGPRLTRRLVATLAPRGSLLNRLASTVATELRWQRREARYIVRTLRRRLSALFLRGGSVMKEAHSSKVFRLVVAPPDTLLAEKGTAALFCVTIYFGFRGSASAHTFRQLLRDESQVSAVEAALATALGSAGVEVSNVTACVVALLDEKYGTQAAVVDARLAVIAALSLPPPSRTRRLSLTQRLFARMDSMWQARKSRHSSAASELPEAATPTPPPPEVPVEVPAPVEVPVEVVLAPEQSAPADSEEPLDHPEAGDTVTEEDATQE